MKTSVIGAAASKVGQGISKVGQGARSGLENTVVYSETKTGGKVIKIVLIGAGIFIAYKMIQSIMKSKPQREEVASASSELDKLNQSSITRQSISKSQAESLASTLHTAMDGYGTDEDAIISIFYKLKNNADYLALQKAYGVREISSGKLNPEPNFKGTMASALRNELENGWVKKINDLLIKKKITYRV